MQRRAFLHIAGGALASAWAGEASAQQPALPVIAFANGGAPEPSAPYVAAFRKGLSEAGLAEGRNVSVEYTGSAANISACRTSWRTWCAAAWR